MELLVELSNKKHIIDNVDGIILPLKDYSVESVLSYSITEVKEICHKASYKIFIKINRNLWNDDISKIKKILLELEKLNIAGIFFYDLAILQLKRELNLKTPLIWNQTHMVNNWKSSNYFYTKGVKYALLGKELTLEEIIEINKKSKIKCMVEVVSKPSIAFSRRKLLTNFYQDLNKPQENNLQITEKVSNLTIDVSENIHGTSFFSSTITNGTSIIKDLYQEKVPYIIMREYGIDCFQELVKDTKEYISNKCCDENYILKYKKLGDNTNFFFKKTIYKVKKNG